MLNSLPELEKEDLKYYGQNLLSIIEDYNITFYVPVLPLTVNQIQDILKNEGIFLSP